MFATFLTNKKHIEGVVVIIGMYFASKEQQEQHGMYFVTL